MMNRFKDTVQKYKNEIYMGLFAAGCASIMYALSKQQSIQVQLNTFKQLINNNSIKQVMFRDNDLYFHTVLPQWFKVDVKTITTQDLQKLIGDISVIEMSTRSTFEKYKMIIYVISGTITLLIGKFLYTNIKKLSEIELQPSRLLSQPELKYKIQSIPRLFSSNQQYAKKYENHMLYLSSVTSQNAQKLGRSLTNFLQKLKQKEIFN